MIRAILKRRIKHSGTEEFEGMLTVEFEAEELERILRSGGVDPERGEYDIVDFVGVELIEDDKK